VCSSIRQPAPEFGTKMIGRCAELAFLESVVALTLSTCNQ
jgi:hypothetical protein